MRRQFIFTLAMTILCGLIQTATAQDAKPTHTTDDLKTVKSAVESGKAVLLDVREQFHAIRNLYLPWCCFVISSLDLQHFPLILLRKFEDVYSLG